MTVRVSGPRRWRAIGWGAAAALLLLPLVAMQLTREVDWTAGDFAVFAALLGATGLGIELVVRRSRARMWRAAGIAAMLAGFVATWAVLAVGLGD